MSCLRYSAALLLLAVAIVAPLTHVCVLPVHEGFDAAAVLQAETRWAHGGHLELTAPGTPHDGAHFAHAGACSATRAAGAPAVASPAGAVALAPDASASVRVVSVAAAVAGGPPRLFLLHGALLI